MFQLYLEKQTLHPGISLAIARISRCVSRARQGVPWNSIFVPREVTFVCWNTSAVRRILVFHKANNGGVQLVGFSCNSQLAINLHGWADAGCITHIDVNPKRASLIILNATENRLFSIVSARPGLAKFQQESFFPPINVNRPGKIF
jgi:hypothetical protein